MVPNTVDDIHLAYDGAVIRVRYLDRNSLIIYKYRGMGIRNFAGVNVDATPEVSMPGAVLDVLDSIDY